MDSLWAGLQDPACVICAAILSGCSGFPGLLLLNRTGGQTFAAGCAIFGSLIAACNVLALPVGGRTAPFTSWALPLGFGTSSTDFLAPIFLLPIFMISGCAALHAARTGLTAPIEEPADSLKCYRDRARNTHLVSRGRP